MHTVILDGADLVKFQDYMQMGLDGRLGDIQAVQFYVQEDGRIVFGTNGYTSEPLGRPNSPLAQPVYSNPEEALEEAVIAEGSGNPYANVTDDDSLNEGTDIHPRSSCLYPAGCTGCLPTTLEDRVIRLERFAQAASSQYGLPLVSEYGSSIPMG